MHNFTSNMQCRLMLTHACLVQLQKRCSACSHAVQAYVGTCMFGAKLQKRCSVCLHLHAVDLVKDDDSMHAKTGLEYWMVRQQNKCGQKKQYLSAAEFDIPPPLPISIWITALLFDASWRTSLASIAIWDCKASCNKSEHKRTSHTGGEEIDHQWTLHCRFTSAALGAMTYSSGVGNGFPRSRRVRPLLARRPLRDHHQHTRADQDSAHKSIDQEPKTKSMEEPVRDF